MLREPLLHFLLIGAGLFIAFSQMNGSDISNDGNSKQIIITQADLNVLSASWMKAKGRPATAEEREQQLKYYIQEQVLYREAMVMGLDKNDVVVRRRLAKKMKYIFNDLSVVSEPTDEELKEFIAQHKNLFIQKSEVSFSQIYFNPAEHAQSIKADAQLLLEDLKQKPEGFDAINLGDRTLLPFDFRGERKSEIASMFGDSFTEQVFSLDTNSWQGPIESAYGIHLVYIRSRSKDALLPFGDIRNQAKKQWSLIKQQEANELFYQSLAKKYDVILTDDVKNNAQVNP